MSKLLVRQFVNRELGNSSYLIASAATGKAAVIDPERDVEKYIEAAEERGLQIVYGLETHLHADFISGVHELAHALEQKGQTDYQIGVSAAGGSEFEHLPLSEGDRLSLGDVQLQVIATPGHSKEHIGFLAYLDEGGETSLLFSGGSLIVGGTGRTDLHGEANTKPLAHELFNTIHRKLADLPDDVVVYPTHGAGSFCNTTTSSERVTTIGKERQSNPFFQYDQEDLFVTEALAHLSSFPSHYQRLPAVNRASARVLGGVPELTPLSAQQVAEAMEAGALLVDVRDSESYLAAHIPNSYGIPVFTPLSAWAGWVLPPEAQLILLGEAPLERHEAVLQLIRIGYDNFAGYLENGMTAWQAAGYPVAQVENIPAERLKDWMEADSPPDILDVRFDYEFRANRLPGARHLEAGMLPHASPEQLPDADQPLVVHCRAGTRSTVAVSLLERQGYNNLYMLRDGIQAWMMAGYDTVKGS
ncbi:MAG: MBL fold metallo-hydrolase [Anaerolineales bacterium]|nr:MBL fold metallo-hydrolase [Anaerolineales bacterium]